MKKEELVLVVAAQMGQRNKSEKFRAYGKS